MTITEIELGCSNHYRQSPSRGSADKAGNREIVFSV